MRRARSHACWQLWLWWILASTAGWGLGGPAGVALSSSGHIVVTGYVGVAVSGIAAGALQWLALRQRFARARLWLPACIAAVAVVSVVVVAVAVVDAEAGSVVGAVALGTVLGLLQWLFLWRKVARGGWWVLASTVGWIGGGFCAGATDALVGWAVIGVVYGAVTGPVLVWLLGQPPPAWKRVPENPAGKWT